MPDIILHGRLRHQFAGPYRWAVASPAEAIRALCYQLPGFQQAISQGHYRVVRGHPKRGLVLDEKLLDFRLGEAPLHIMPVTVGKKRGGAGKIILGSLLLVTAFALTGGLGAGVAGALGAGSGMGWGASVFGGGLLGFITPSTLASMGIGMVLTGVTSLLAPQPRPRPIVDQNPSYLFSGPANSTEQGVAIPLVYGRAYVGSVVISAGIKSEDFDAATDPTTPADTTGVTDSYSEPGDFYVHDSSGA